MTRRQRISRRLGWLREEVMADLRRICLIKGIIVGGRLVVIGSVVAGEEDGRRVGVVEGV